MHYPLSGQAKVKVQVKQNISDWWFGTWFGTWLLLFHILGIILPTDEIIFFRGVGIPSTRNMYSTLKHESDSHNIGD
jgi:hypothetical protein